PFMGDTSFELAQKHVSEQPASLSELCASIDPQLEKLIHKAMAKNAAERYQTVDELRTELQAIHSSVSAVRPSLKLKVAKPTAGMVFTTLGVLAFICLAGLGTFSFFK